MGKTRKPGGGVASRLRFRPRSGGRFRRLASGWPLLLALAVTLLAGAAIVLLRGRADASRQAQILLIRLEGHGNRLSALEWQAIADRGVTAELEREHEEAVLELDGTLGSLRHHALDPAVLASLEATENAYRRAVEEEFRLLQEHRIAAALRVDSEKVDPTFEALREKIGRADLTLRGRTSRDLAAANIGSWLAVAIALGAVSLLLRRFLRERQEARLAQVERSAREASDRRVRSLVENGSDVIVILDEESAIRYVGGPVQRILGHDPGRLVGGSVLSLIHPDEVVKAEALLAACRTSPAEVISGELLLQDSASGWRPFAAVASDRTGDPNVAGIVVNLRDIGAQKSLEEQLRQSQRLEAVGRVAGGVAHDFNNLLTAISGYSELLGSQLDDGAQARDQIDGILESTERAAALTRQLLAFSRKQVLQPTALDPNAVVTGMEDMLRQLIGERVELVTRWAHETHRVKADLGQFERVLTNLVLNARDAMPEGGRMSIETANVELDAAFAREHPSTEPGLYVMLAVGDTGTGMDAETQSHIFEPFFSTKEPGKGTGLGLSTVYGIVKQSGGHIFVESELGIGTTVRVYLPAVAEAVEVDAPVGGLPPESVQPGDPHRRGTEDAGPGGRAERAPAPVR